jgi:hypothetical protein
MPLAAFRWFGMNYWKDLPKRRFRLVKRTQVNKMHALFKHQNHGLFLSDFDQDIA